MRVIFQRNHEKRVRRSGAVILLLALCGCASVGQGSLAQADPIGPLPHRYYEYFAEFETEYRQALAGDCTGVEEVLARTPSRSIDKSLIEDFRGQLYDQALCQPYDPEAAYRAFRAAEQNPDLGAWHFTLWKRWHGHGVAQDRKAAREGFALWLLRLTGIAGVRGLGRDIEIALSGRPIPPSLLDGIAWAEELEASSDAEKTSFALDLMRGQARDWSGTQLPASKEVGSSMLHSVYDSYPQAYYRYGVAAVRGELPGVSWKDGETALFMATRHCIDGSFLAIARANESTATPSNKRLRDAYRWLAKGELDGFPLSDERERVGRLLDDLAREILDSVVPEYERVGCS